MGATYPDLYAAIGVHSGLACGAADDIISAFAAMRQGNPLYSSSGETSAVLEGRPPIPTIVFHGDRDTIVHPRNADNVIACSMTTTNWQKKVHRGQVPGGHAYTRTIHAEANGREVSEQWCIHGAGHAWSGGVPAVPTPIREGRTRLKKCYVSFSTILPSDATRATNNYRTNDDALSEKPETTSSERTAE
jgi:poly(3-hydroxybutyrate) depolymerase